MQKQIHNTTVTYDGDFFERVVVKPFSQTPDLRVPVVKIDDVYVYFPKEGEIIISKEDINAF
jgi:hypothetical protein